MTTLREAAQQALEALVWEADSEPALYAAQTYKAIADLRAALAQQAEPVAGRAFLERILTAMEGVIDVADRKTDEFDALRSCVIDLTVMLHAAPPQRTMVPLTEEEIYHATGHCGVSKYTAINIARVIEEASWEKNHGQA